MNKNIIYIFVALQYFVYCYAGVNDYKPSGDTPIIEAVFYQNVPDVRDLLNKGADPRIKKKDTKFDAYHFAFEGKDAEIKKLLLNWQDENGETIFIKEVWNGNVFAVRKYLKLGADPFIKKHDNANAIDIAMLGQSLLVEQDLVNYQSASGETPLIKAVFAKDAKRVETLLKHGANIELKKHDKAGVFDFVGWMDPGWEKDQMQTLLENHQKIPSQLSKNKTAVSKLLNAAFDQQKKRDFLNQEFTPATGINFYTINGSTDKLDVPVFHSYRGSAFVPFRAKIPSDFIENIPQRIKDELIKHDIQEIDICFVIQSFAGDNLIRPHYWMDKDMPTNFSGVRFNRYVWAGMYDASDSLEADVKNNTLRLFNFSAHDSRISPNFAKVSRVKDGFAGFVWTLIIDNDIKNHPKRAVATLHWLMPFIDAREIGRTITARASTFNLLLVELKKQNTLPKLLPSLEILLK